MPLSKVFSVPVTRVTRAVGVALVTAPRAADVTPARIDAAAAEAVFRTVETKYHPGRDPVEEAPAPPPPTLLAAYRRFVAERAADGDYPINTLPDYLSWRQANQVKILVQFAETYGLKPEEVDGLVHTTKGAEGSAINNGGLDEQVEYLVESGGYEATRHELLGLLQLADADWPEEVVPRVNDDEDEDDWKHEE